MKMENEIRAANAGTVSELAVSSLQPISIGQQICVVG
jgi:biotin carboxyl carrier protein